MSSGSFDSQASFGIVSSLVPVVGVKSKGTRNFVLSVFVPVVGVRVKGTMVRLWELKGGVQRTDTVVCCCAW